VFKYSAESVVSAQLLDDLKQRCYQTKEKVDFATALINYTIHVVEANIEDVILNLKDVQPRH
jgi:hypothetical protein